MPTVNLAPRAEQSKQGCGAAEHMQDGLAVTSRTAPTHPSTTSPSTGVPSAEVERVQFSYQGTAYTIDLDPGGAARFHTALAPFIAAGRRVGGQRSRYEAPTTGTGPRL